MKKFITYYNKIIDRIRYSKALNNVIYYFRPYYLNAIGEGILNPKYSGYYLAGRLEVYDVRSDSPYSIDEIRYFTPNGVEFNKFVDKYDLKQISVRKLKKLTKEVNEKYNIFHPEYNLEN